MIHRLRVTALKALQTTTCDNLPCGCLEVVIRVQTVAWILFSSVCMSMHDHFKTNKNSDTQMCNWVWGPTLIHAHNNLNKVKVKSIAIHRLTHSDAYTISQALSSSDITLVETKLKHQGTCSYQSNKTDWRFHELWFLRVYAHLWLSVLPSVPELLNHTCLCCSYLLSPWYCVFPYSHCLRCLKMCSSVWTRK